MKRWQVEPTVSDEVAAQFPEIDRLVLQLMWNRGIRSQAEIDVFVGPDWSRDTCSPDLFLNMKAAVEKVFEVFAAGEVITVHGDYDADGVCGSAVLVATLREIARAFGFDERKITTYIPHREKEGYGMSVATIEHLHAHEMTKLVITVDCGISNKEAIDRGIELGIATIVCDHHTMPAELPTAAILIHPLVPGETYPNKNLCGTGVAFKLTSGLIAEARIRQPQMFSEGHEKWLLDLVAIATVTDVMPLAGENRVLEHFGLLVLNKTKRIGLKKLIEVAGSKGALDTFSIGFQIGPRINAAGRMDHANGALYLLLEEDETRATELAAQLNAANVARQKASDQMYKNAKLKIGEMGNRKLIVVWNEAWPAGLVGLVAGKLVGDYGRPVIVAGRDGDRFVGSGRSIEGFDVTAALRSASEHLDKFGGHPQACGFSTTGEARWLQAVAAMQAYADAELADKELAPTIRVDAEIALESVTWGLLDELARFEPFGEGNRKPVFVSRRVAVAGMDTIGADGKHLRLTVRSPRGKLVKLIGFGFGDRVKSLSLGMLIDVAYEVGVNEWNGNRELQLRIVDI